MIPFFCVFVQTIKNLIAFVFLIFLVSINLMLFYSIEFFPIFFMLIYIGAIVVTTLFMVLTFDLRAEYSSRKVYEPKALFNAFIYFISSFVFLAVNSLFERSLWKYGSLDEYDRIEILNQCLARRGLHANFCNTHFGGAANSRGLYNAVGESINDVAVISDNLYSNYGALFVILGVLLTMALLAALTLLKR